MPAVLKTTRPFYITLHGVRRYVNSRQTQRVIEGNITTTGTTTVSDLMSAIQATVEDMNDFHFIRSLQVTIGEPEASPLKTEN